MLVSCERKVARCAVAATCLFACLLGSGCARWSTTAGPLWRNVGEDHPQRDPKQDSADNSPIRFAIETIGAAHATSPEDRAILARATDDAGRSVWIVALRPDDQAGHWAMGHWAAGQDGDAAVTTGPRDAWRWRYPDLDEILARPPRRRPNLLTCLTDEDPTVSANAAIALGRGGDDRAIARLVAVVQAPRVALAMRCAAVEALATLTSPTAIEALGELTDQYGGSEPGMPYLSDLHAELIRGLVRHVVITDDPHCIAALGSRSADVRLATLLAWTTTQHGDLPDEAVRLWEDRDPRVRAAALTALARCHHPQAPTILADALRDFDTQVRVAAIVAWGVLGDEAARAHLQQLTNDSNERLRAEAITALAVLGDMSSVLAAADDTKWRVRARVAEALRGCPDRRGMATAEHLLADSSSQVQGKVVTAVRDWPLSHAAPVLLTAMRQICLTTRKAAAKQLAERWPMAASFSVHARPQQRAEQIAELEKELRQQMQPADRVSMADVAAAAQQMAPDAAARAVARVEELLARNDMASLAAYGPGLEAVLETLVFERQYLLPESVYENVLPEINPSFALLRRLGDVALAERRRAVTALAVAAKQRPLRRLAIDRLARLTASEPDPLVLRSVLIAVAGDPSEPAMRLAHRLIGHVSPEVRRLACENLASCPDRAHAAVLLPALNDTSPSVVRAAVVALGRGRHCDDMAPLRRLLLASDGMLRLETAIALSRLGDPTGKDALERLAYHDDAQVRAGAAAWMGETGDAAFLATLIRMLDDKPAVRRAALQGLPRVAGYDAARNDQRSLTTVERVRCWKEWHTTRVAAPLAQHRREDG